MVSFRSAPGLSPKRRPLGTSKAGHDNSFDVPNHYQSASQLERDKVTASGQELHHLGKENINPSSDYDALFAFKHVQSVIPQMISELVFQLSGDVTSWGGLNASGKGLQSVLKGKDVSLKKSFRQKFTQTVNKVLTAHKLPVGNKGLTLLADSLQSHADSPEWDPDHKITVFKTYDKSWGLMTPLVSMMNDTKLRITPVKGKSDIQTIIRRISDHVMLP